MHYDCFELGNEEAIQWETGPIVACRTNSTSHTRLLCRCFLAFCHHHYQQSAPRFEDSTVVKKTRKNTERVEVRCCGCGCNSSASKYS